MDTQRLILFVVFSFSLLMLWEAWQRESQPLKPPSAATTSASRTPADVPTASPAPGQAALPAQSGANLARATRIRVVTDVFKAEIDTQGGDLRRLELLRHRATDDTKKNFVLLSEGQPHVYVAQSGLLGPNLPTHHARFEVAALDYRLAPGQQTLEVPLRWRNDAGVTVTKTYIFRRNNYLVDVRWDVSNASAAPVPLTPYFQFLRDGNAPSGESFFLPTFTGAAVYTEEGKFQKVGFDEIEKNKTDYPKFSRDGWIAMLQHYFVGAWLPRGDVDREFYTRRVDSNLYAAGALLKYGTVAPQQVRSVSTSAYIGPQEQQRLKALAESNIAPHLDLTVDYGWLTIIAAPLYWVLAAIFKLVGNWGVAIIILTILIKLAFYPLSAKSYRSMANMRVLAPKLQKLKEQFGDDRQKMHQAMMDLYKTEKINPLGGCLPILVQIPVFIALYWVLLSSVEIRQAPFFGWIQDLSVPDPYYVLPIIMAITMFVQTKLNPTPPDPVQAKVMMMMPLVFGVFFFFFPAGLVLYWVVNNLLSIAQQWQITRQIEHATAAKGNARR